MTTANKLTVFRMLLTPFFAFCAFMAHRTGTGVYYLCAALIFAAASFTDFLDGYIARKYNQISTFGIFMDPLADKVLTTTALLYMITEGVCDPFAAALVLAREFTVAGLRMLAAGSGSGKPIAANKWGKAKTLLQMITVLFYYFGMYFESRRNFVCSTTWVLCWCVALLTVISGVIYLYVNRGYFKSSADQDNKM